MDAHAAHRAAEREAAQRQNPLERPAAVDPDAHALPAQDLPSHQDTMPRG
jgi:hypothetical protein